MTDSALLDRLRNLAGGHLEELAGAVISADFPLTNTLVNRLIAERLSRSAGPLSAVEVDALDDDTFSARICPRATMIPAIGIVARIDEQPELPERPRLGLRWSVPGLGPLGLLAGPALSFLKTLPPGIRAEDDRLLVDVHELLRSQGLRELLPYVSKMRVHTRRGAFVMRFELRIS